SALNQPRGERGRFLVPHVLQGGGAGLPAADGRGRSFLRALQAGGRTGLPAADGRGGSLLPGVLPAGPGSAMTSGAAPLGLGGGGPGGYGQCHDQRSAGQCNENLAHNNSCRSMCRGALPRQSEGDCGGPTSRIRVVRISRATTARPG